MSIGPNQKFDREVLERARKEFQQPGLSPWAEILPWFDWYVRTPDLAGIFGGIREFVVAAASEPFLKIRHVYPSTINMTVFQTGEPVPRDEAYRHPRVIVSPWGPRGIRLRFYASQKERPERRWVERPPVPPEGIRIEFSHYDRWEPEPTLTWEGESREGIELIRDRFSAPDDVASP